MAMELSSDLVEEILSRVPATSLARWRYACKQWQTLIEDPRFVKRHMSVMRCREQQFMAFNEQSSSSGSRVSCVGIDFNELNEPSLNSHAFKPLDLPLINMAHCDGLLLLVLSNKLLVVNPLLKQARSIKRGSGFYHPEDAYGLGHINNQSDYKMVKFGSASCHRIGCDPSGHTVDIYEFKSDSWKVVYDKSFEGFEGKPNSSVCVRGTPYWIGCTRYSNSLIVQSFDFLKERFEPLSLPTSSIANGIPVSLGSFRGDHLSLLCKSGSTGKIHIWVMKQRWSKLMTIHNALDLSICSTYFIENNGNLVVFPRRCHNNIYIVDEDKEFQILKYCSDTYRIIGRCCYVPSLLQVPGFSGCEEEEQ